MMHFVLQTPSLQHLAQVKIVAHLWSQRDSFTQIPRVLKPLPVDQYVSGNVREWLIITEKVESKVSVLPLPEHCKKQLLNLIKPLGNEIVHWCYYYNENDRMIQLLDISLPPQLCWTMHGTIDYAKTAELMVKDERVDLQTRFELACIYCFEDEARALFERVAKERGEEWVPVLRYARKEDLSQLILFFARSINLGVRGEFRRNWPRWLADESSIKKRLFDATLSSGNRVMCEYLFNHFNEGEKEQVLEKCGTLILGSACSPLSSTGNLLYYFSLLNEEQQRRMWQERAYNVLNSLLHWPLQSLFMEAALKHDWQSSMQNRHYFYVLSAIIGKISDAGFQDYDYAQLFWECWALSPADIKQIYFNEFRNVLSLLRTRREEFIKLVLNEAPAHQIRALCEAYHEISRVLMDERSISDAALMDERCISDAALMECKEKAILNSSNDKDNEEKRLRSEHLTRLVDIVMESRLIISRHTIILKHKKIFLPKITPKIF